MNTLTLSRSSHCRSSSFQTDVTVMVWAARSPTDIDLPVATECTSLQRALPQS